MLTRTTLFLLFACHCGTYAATQMYERYDFNGRLKDTAAPDTEPVRSANLTFVPLGTDRQAGENLQKDPAMALKLNLPALS